MESRQRADADVDPGPVTTKYKSHENSHLCLIAGYRIELNYLWIPSAEFSAQRVASRVANGGHDIPAEAIARRYGKSLRNLGHLYMQLADYVAVWNNSAERPVLVYELTHEGEAVFDEAIWAQIEEYGS